MFYKLPGQMTLGNPQIPGGLKQGDRICKVVFHIGFGTVNQGRILAVSSHAGTT